MDVHLPQHTLLASVVPPIPPVFVVIVHIHGGAFVTMVCGKRAAAVVVMDGLRGLFVE